MNEMKKLPKEYLVNRRKWNGYYFLNEIKQSEFLLSFDDVNGFANSTDELALFFFARIINNVMEIIIHSCCFTIGNFICTTKRWFLFLEKSKPDRSFIYIYSSICFWIDCVLDRANRHMQSIMHYILPPIDKSCKWID